MEYQYYIGCDNPPTQTTNGRFNRCLTTESEVQTQEQVSMVFSPVLNFEQANYLGGLVFITWGMIWIAKRKAHLFSGRF